ncbi:MAG: M14 family metallopeptidase [Desulfobacterales bacterium]
MPLATKNLGLFNLFPSARIFVDTDGDGYPDRLAFFIGVHPRLDDRGVWAGILNLCARLAAEVVGLVRPIAGPLAAAPAAGPCLLVYRPSKRHPSAVEMARLAADRIALRGHSPAAIAALLNTLAVAAPQGTSPFPGWAFMQSDLRRPGRIRVLNRQGECLGELRLAPPGASILRQSAELADCSLLDMGRMFYHPAKDASMSKPLRLWVDLAAERVAPRLGLGLAEVVARTALEASEVELPVAGVGPSPAGGVTLRLSGNASIAPRVVRTDGSGSGVVFQVEGTPAAAAGLLRRWIKIGFPDGSSGAPAERIQAAVAAAVECICRGVGTARGRRPRCAGGPAESGLRFRHGWVSETRRIVTCLRRLPRGEGRVEGIVLVSKPKAQRRALASEARAILRAKGYRPRLAVLNAYKPGLSWLLEVVLPQIKRIAPPARLEVAYRPFAPGNGALEMKSRWLQEIFPGPDLLAAALGVEAETVRLVKRDNLSDAYRVRAWSRHRRIIFESAFTPRFTRFPYLSGRPAMGVVHPTCGGIRLAVGGKVILDREIPTDREIFWRHFQTVWLPAMEAAMLERLQSGRETQSPAFWEEARFDVAIDETDMRLGLGEERVAPMEALHEDIYFVLLDFFKAFSQEHGLPASISFGRIFPKVSAVAARGRPSARFRAHPLAAVASETPGPITCRPRVSSLSWADGRLLVGIDSRGLPFRGASIREVLEDARARGHDLRCDPDGDTFVLRLPIPHPPTGVAGRKKAVSAPPMDRLLKSSEVGGWVRRLGELEPVRRWPAGTSWRGRPIWAVEVAHAGSGIASVARLRLLKPTLLMNARHHANEISSTNAALRLVWELATTGWGRRVLRRVNVAVVPIENADGVATLEALLPGARGHKLHAARYNALGVEWYADYFDPAPRFPEARVKPRLWRRWLPLIVLDAHGVPSHEWEQPFSGYAPVRFRQYWIPRSFIYAVVPFLDQAGHPGFRPAHRLVRVMAKALRADAAITALNRELGCRYRRYARGPEPDTFPPGAAKTLVALPPEKRIAGLNFAVQRFPATLSEIITEVPDEVVSGRLLDLCARGHLLVAKALIDFLCRQPSGRLMRKPLRGGGLNLSWQSGRPRGGREELLMVS